MQLQNLNTKFLGKTAQYFTQIDSTQKEIWRLVKSNNINNGHLVIAEIQTDGVGTHGRTWYTDEKGNIAFSIFINLNIPANKIQGITIALASIITHIFYKKYGIELQIKEPNDIVYNGKKIGGILTEAKIYKDEVKYIVIGIGINTNKSYFREEIKDVATSIKQEFNIHIDNKEFIKIFCEEFEKEMIKMGILAN